MQPIYEQNSTKYRELFHKACVRRDKAQRGSKTAEKEQKSVSFWYSKMYQVGYFRDQYSCWTMLRTVGLSWWNDVTPLLTKKKRVLKGKNLKKFLDMVKTAKQKIPTQRELKKAGASVDDLKEARQYFIDKRNQLVAFLQQAVDNKYDIECSL
jgi:hypothetical protein